MSSWQGTANSTYNYLVYKQTHYHQFLEFFLSREFGLNFWWIYSWDLLFFWQRSSSLTIGEKLCAAFIPFIGIIEALVFAVAGCCDFHKNKHHKKLRYGFRELSQLARESQCNVLYFYFFCVTKKMRGKCCLVMGEWGKREKAFRVVN